MNDLSVETMTDSVVLDSLLGNRHSCRRFEDREVPRPILERILELAQKTPSWCNVQPWQVSLVSGQSRSQLANSLIDAANDGDKHPDFAPPSEYHGVYRDRRRESGFALYASLGIERGDLGRRREQSLENFRFFGAPHVAVITTDERLGTYGAIDCGGYVTALLLAAESLGIAAVPQAAIAMYPDIIRRELDLEASQRVVCGVAFGYEAAEDPVNSFRTGRAAVADAVDWLY